VDGNSILQTGGKKLENPGSKGGFGCGGKPGLEGPPGIPNKAKTVERQSGKTRSRGGLDGEGGEEWLARWTVVGWKAEIDGGSWW
jgi:hypothetical protein